MSFLAPAFLVALIAVAGPVIIHLLNRRRFRTVEWAAMDFLRVAVRRNKRVLELRDLLLLLLRTLAVLFFILAMAQPFRSSSNTAAYRGEPVHAIVVVDNSLSMAYKPLDKTLLEVAQGRARSLIGDLPAGSRMSIIPLCDADDTQTRASYTSSEDALEALDRIQIADRANSMSEAAERARRAGAEVADMPTKRVIILSDMQQNAWSDNDLETAFAKLENVQLVSVGPAERSNVWIESLAVRDGMADTGTPAIFTATLRYEGDAPRTGIRATLKVDEEVVDDRVVSLTPGQHLHLVFEHTFDVAGSPGEPLYVPVTLGLSGDELNEDNQRAIMVPVVARIPVVFIDQHGQQEYARMNRYGETYPLRNLLAAQSSSDPMDKSLIEVRHLTMSQVNESVLADARLVAIAGVRAPTAEAVGLLREYAEQGGPVFLAAGGEFDAVAWNEMAWNEGQGILPAPLKDASVGSLPPPATAREWPIFRINPQSLSSELVDLDLSPAEANEIISLPFFYKAVGVDESGIDQAIEYTGEKATWLKWSPFQPVTADSKARVLGRYDNREAFVVSRNLGKGSVIMMTSGCFPQWNNLAADVGVLLLDGMLRGQLTRSLPDHNLPSNNQLLIPVNTRDQKADFNVTIPGRETPVSLAPDALGANVFALRLERMTRRGVYRIERVADAGQENGWTKSYAMNGPAGESELQNLTASAFAERYTGDQIQWVGADDPISLDGGFTGGQRLWKLFLALAVSCLLIEMFMLKEKRPVAAAREVAA